MPFVRHGAATYKLLAFCNVCLLHSMALSMDRVISSSHFVVCAKLSYLVGFGAQSERNKVLLGWPKVLPVP